MSERIQEIFAPKTITTVDELLSFLISEVERRGGDPGTIRMVNTSEAIPNVEFSDEWPCWTLQFDQRS